MEKKTDQKQGDLNKKRDEYQILFELAPCYITVQDKNLRLIRYNREFADKFFPRTGDYCYQAYKGRSERCKVCPVLKTFEDGKPHSSEETGVSKDGTKTYWVVRSAPIKNADGEVVAAMEMSLDMTQMKFLEEAVEKSEKKYQTIFNTIPNPVFVLDGKTLDVLDCNNSVSSVYGFNKNEIVMSSFLNLFEEDEREMYSLEIRSSNNINRVRQIRKDGKTIYVNIRISASEYLGRETLLVTTSDITTRLMAEQQLIQASKMATLGEMATGVAHELNQPLSVIKTSSSFIIKKVRKNETIKEEILRTLAEEIDSHVDRASKIINHMREFGRKSDVKEKKVWINEPLEKALYIFNQQLKLREINVVKELGKDLPPILADPNRLEQVFINLLINSRDAIEEKSSKTDQGGAAKEIFLRTSLKNRMINVEVKDTGTGIPKHILDKIFDPFFTTKKVGKGTGLGLSISYGIIQDYGGSIKVKTSEGEGSTFIIQFPFPGKT
ncbi:MAG: PAS domain S-box protein [Deltaproteobacteria bacterium]|nr:PAS domain S-box protein [Deltaproteobacteria bacterium]MBW1736508.1 PAS domain S-box protein [Deltaproteobacteria bacterium]MBW1907966.1 PAS domain S-box protein [Deltaproteobacteria bacterium]MBW2034257.1 PAS domain S-box protein [Deltaproteobacteria bacterium]MBW2114562.1 PAS domain S-box protein [Deltaproteobacteria bacterium]